MLEDVSKIVGHEFLQAPEIKQALRDYYENHKLQLNLNDGSQVIVTSHGRQEPIVRYAQSSHSSSIPSQAPAQPKKKALWEDDEDEEGAQEAQENQADEEQQ